MEDYVLEAVFDFLENGGELPAEASQNPQNRFMFQNAMARMTYQKSCLAIDKADKATILACDTSRKMASFKETVDTRIKALVDKVDVRLGLIGGIIVVANVILVVLVRLWPQGG